MAEKVKKVLDKVSSYLKLEELEKVQKLKEVADKLGVKVATLVLVFLMLSCVLLIFSFATTIITSMIGFIYPTWKSFRAIKDKKLEAQQQWLTYWVCYSFCQVAYPVLSYLPYYTWLIIGLYIWMMHPQTKGAMILYNSVFRQLFQSQEEWIDAKLRVLKKKAEQAGLKVPSDKMLDDLVADEDAARPHND